MLSEIYQRQILHSITYMWKKDKDKDLQTHRNRIENGCEGLGVGWGKQVSLVKGTNFQLVRQIRSEMLI